ncbi:MAG: desulfoferrodoxin family protein [Anaerovoracaceae bacterium]
MSVKFLKCNHCGNIATMLEDKGVPIACCGENMDLLKANTTDAALEKHVPEVKQNGNIVSVQVGSTIHPMTEEHAIKWIYLETEKGGQFKVLPVTGEPKAEFCAKSDKAIAVYEYCNLHGLWMTVL